MNLVLNSIKGALAASALTFGAYAHAAEFILDSSETGEVGKRRGNVDTVLVGFSGNSEITDSQIDVSYDPAAVSVSVKALGNAGCSNPKAGLIRVVSPDLGGKALGEKVGAYCQVTVKSLKGPLSPNALTASNAFCSGTAGVEKSCVGEAVSTK